jgi:hypothetical protein
MILSICFFCTVAFNKGYAQAFCRNDARSGYCSSGGSGDQADLWEMTAPTGNLSYSMTVSISDNRSAAQAIFWGDGPNVNIWTLANDPSTWYQAPSGTITGLSTTQVLDVEKR